MRTCSICQFENDDLAVICERCRAYVQARVPNLDFFDMFWHIIESPGSAMKRVAVAEHKNYTLFLWGLCGIVFSFTAMWVFNLGDQFESLVYLLAVAASVGPLCGIIVLYLFSISIHFIATAIFRGSAGAKNTVAIVAYSCIPIVMTLASVLPVKLIVFGIFMFSDNPSPMVISPAPYVILILLDAFALLWSLALLTIGIRVINRFSVSRSIGSVLTTLMFFSILALLTIHAFVL